MPTKVDSKDQSYKELYNRQLHIFYDTRIVMYNCSTLYKTGSRIAAVPDAKVRISVMEDLFNATVCYFPS